MLVVFLGYVRNRSIPQGRRVIYSGHHTFLLFTACVTVLKSCNNKLITNVYDLMVYVSDSDLGETVRDDRCTGKATQSVDKPIGE